MRKSTLSRLLCTSVLLVVAAGCASTADKAGSDTTTLQFAAIDDISGNGQSYGPAAFVDALTEISGGRLKVDVEYDYGGGAPDAESTLVAAIAAGEVDGGWPSSRAFDGAGIPALKVLEAPMTITNYAAEKELVGGPTADALLARLDGSGVVGLGMAVGPLRRPFAAHWPLLAVADWEGVAVRAFNSPVQSDTISALGGIPANVGFAWLEQIADGTLGAAEFDIAQYEKNGESTAAGYITANVVLWPKVPVLSMSQQRFDALSDEQRDWVRQAAAAAVQASVEATYDETTPAVALCSRGARFFEAGADQLAELHSAVQPVLDELAADPAEAALLSDILAIAGRHPEPEAPGVSADCRDGAVTTETGTDAGTNTATDITIPTDVSAIPDGVYRAQISTAEAANAELPDDFAGIWTMTVTGGTYENHCRPMANPGIDCGKSDTTSPLEMGDLRGTGSTAYFVPNAQRIAQATGCTLPPSGTLAGHCGPQDPYWADWELVGDTLNFSNTVAVALTIKAWTKIS